MRGDLSYPTRRQVLLGTLSAGALAFFTPGVFAGHLDATPAVEEGPFYPYQNMPLDTDNDLIIVSNSVMPAVGEITHLVGRVLDANGTPIKDALVEIWQCDAHGIYAAQGPVAGKEKNFQGYGKFSTGADGAYRFRTIKPVPYSGRLAPHIHFKIRKGGQELLTTQMYIRGYADNVRDGVYMSVRDPVDRELTLVDFKAVKDSKIGELAATFDVVVGRTPADTDDHHGGSL